VTYSFIEDEIEKLLHNNLHPIQLQKPAYGCLKNGSLPTYRNWKNQTQRVYPVLPIQPSMPIQSLIPIQSTVPSSIQSTLYDNPTIEKARAICIMKTKERIKEDQERMKVVERKNKIQ
jgi:hypothetical protein